MSDNPLSHLSREEVKEVIERYYNSNDKIKDICTAYNISLQVRNLFKFFPEEIHSQTCEHCQGQNLQSRRISRDKTKYKNSSFYRSRVSKLNENKYCPNCDHRPSKYCLCDGCKKKASDEKAAALQRQKALIKELSSSPMSNRISAVSDLSLEEAIFIVACVDTRLDNKLTEFSLAKEKEGAMFPNKNFGNRVVRALICNDIIGFSESSNLSHLVFDVADTKIIDYALDLTTWKLLPNYSIEEKRNLIKNIRQAFYSIDYPDTWRFSLPKLCKELAVLECVDNFNSLIRESNRSLTLSTTKLFNIFNSILDTYSIEQTLYFSYISVTYNSKFISDNNIHIYKQEGIYCKGLVNTISTYEEKGWEVKRGWRRKDCPQSQFSATLFGDVLQMNNELSETYCIQNDNQKV